MNGPSLYRIELDDYAKPGFVSSSKYYIGSLEEIREWISALKADENTSIQFEKLIDAFHTYLVGETAVTHYVAHRPVPFLKPARLLHYETLHFDQFEWEHINVWGFPYHMRCDCADTTHLWLKSGREYYRYVLARFQNLRYKGPVGGWQPLEEVFWGFPKILFENANVTGNRLAEREKFFRSQTEADEDWDIFQRSPDPDFTEFCNDIFGDG